MTCPNDRCLRILGYGFCLIFQFALCACTTTYGSRAFTVKFETSPKDAILYVIPDTVWAKYKDSLFANTPEAVDKRAVYRCYNNEKQVGYYSYVLVIECGGKRTVRPYMPKEPGEKTIVAAEQDNHP